MGPDYGPNADTKGYNMSEPIGYIDQARAKLSGSGTTAFGSWPGQLAATQGRARCSVQAGQNLDPKVAHCDTVRWRTPMVTRAAPTEC